MALTNELGLVPMAYDLMLTGVGGAGTFVGTLLMDATAEKVGFVGNVWHPTVKTGTINIRKVLFRTGAVTINAASEFRVSLQNVSLTAGPPYQPDGSQDQFYDFKTATAVLTANAWKTTGNLSGDRAVDLSADSAGDANSRRLAVVFEYQVFTAADSVVISAIDKINDLYGMGGCILNVASWASSNSIVPVVAFECDDGTLAFMQGAVPYSALTTASVASNGAIRRAGVKFKFPSQRSIDRAALSIRLANGADGTLVLYDSDGTTVLRSIDVDNDDVRIASVESYLEVPFEPVTLAANTYYRWVYVAGTTTIALVPYGDVASAGLMDGLIFGQNAHWTQHDGTNWADTTTRRPGFGIGVSAYHDGTGGGLLVHPGMTGGIRG